MRLSLADNLKLSLSKTIFSMELPQLEMHILQHYAPNRIGHVIHNVCESHENDNDMIMVPRLD